MSCVAWWNECKKCKKETYDRFEKTTCPACKGPMISMVEYDEDFAEQDRFRKTGQEQFGEHEYE